MGRSSSQRHSPACKGYGNGVTLDFSHPDKPTDNAFVEPSNGHLRDECLNTHRFLSLQNARTRIKAWRRDYNESRPHTSLGWMMPVGYAATAAKIAAESSLKFTLNSNKKPERLMHVTIFFAY